MEVAFSRPLQSPPGWWSPILRRHGTPSCGKRPAADCPRKRRSSTYYSKHCYNHPAFLMLAGASEGSDWGCPSEGFLVCAQSSKLWQVSEQHPVFRPYTDDAYNHFQDPVQSRIPTTSKLRLTRFLHTFELRHLLRTFLSNTRARDKADLRSRKKNSSPRSSGVSQNFATACIFLCLFKNVPRHLTLWLLSVCSANQLASVQQQVEAWLSSLALPLVGSRGQNRQSSGTWGYLPAISLLEIEGGELSEIMKCKRTVNIKGTKKS